MRHSAGLPQIVCSVVDWARSHQDGRVPWPDEPFLVLVDLGLGSFDVAVSRTTEPPRVGITISMQSPGPLEIIHGWPTNVF